MSVSKICAICGDDCSNKPRLKDAKGHYACRACYDAKIAKQAKPKPTPEPIIALDDPTDAAGDDLWNDLDTPSNDAIATPAGACPACGAMLPGGQVVCTSCGHNVSTGRGAKTKVSKQRKPRGQTGADLAKIIAIVGSVLAVIAAIANTAHALMDPEGVGAAVALLVSAVLGSLVVLPTVLTVHVWGTIAAFRDGSTFRGSTLILICIPLLPLVGLHWVITKSGRPILAALGIAYLANIVAGLIGFLIVWATVGVY